LIALSHRLDRSLRALGPAGEAWRAALPGVLADLESRWSLRRGARLDGGRAAYVTEATAGDGRPVVL
jgi:streptomycin 6-kinase